MRLVLFEPDIPQNTGAMLRLAACLGIGADIIMPCGFIFDDKRLRRAGMDYLDLVAVRKHDSWAAYQQWRRKENGGRLVLLSTKATIDYRDFAFAPGDSIMVGRESSGVPDDVHQSADARLRVPIRPEARSLNVALTAAMVLGEAMRQIRGQAHGLSTRSVNNEG